MATRKMMTPRQQKFVAAYLSGKSGVQAAQEAGYSTTASRTRSYELLHFNENVKAALAEAQEKLKVQANFNAETAMAELNEAIVFAKSTKNATAYARCIELKSKLAGLLTEKKEGNSAAFQINIMGLDTPAPVTVEG